MKLFKSLFILTLIFNLYNCEVVQEVNFNADESGQYSLGFDLSEMMNMGAAAESDSKKEQIDSLIVFADILESKKDSISKLSPEKQAQLKQLEAYSIQVKSDTTTNQFKMKINYNFKDLEDLALFGEKLKDQDIKELDMLGNKMKTTDKSKTDEIFNLNDSFETTFNKHKFTLKISPEALAKSEKEKDTTITADNPMANLIRFKLKYRFPYRIKKLSNENAKVLSDFKGIEITANLYQMTSDPKFFDTEVEFE
ncbi:hypothetical protein Q4566_13280 [Tamlana sp. 2_MG-2023]|uniref:hypothetical protein n=1 Tax=unclassified Tamlana TaxID=2614803 RepID=UPI0026E283AD|nr:MULTISPECIES: hypothetical protein [unclassified Tamlana]MDO6761177.1 hypothetical protein [Tamlana sp. 2_MG-2023]MDO6791490.1 hypothetical protein [Tamlana sp. 1_MG-2023]